MGKRKFTSFDRQMNSGGCAMGWVDFVAYWMDAGWSWFHPLFTLYPVKSCYFDFYSPGTLFFVSSYYYQLIKANDDKVVGGGKCNMEE